MHTACGAAARLACAFKDQTLITVACGRLPNCRPAVPHLRWCQRSPLGRALEFTWAAGDLRGGELCRSSPGSSRSRQSWACATHARVGGNNHSGVSIHNDRESAGSARVEPGRSSRQPKIRRSMARGRTASSAAGPQRGRRRARTERADQPAASGIPEDWCRRATGTGMGRTPFPALDPAALVRPESNSRGET